MALKRWLYKDQRPNVIAKFLNNGLAVIHSSGILPNYLVTLEVAGRRSGKLISFPLVMTVVNGERYLVSMLGEDVNWVRNIKAAGGKASLRHGILEEIYLEEVDTQLRAAIIKAYLQIAPGARPHIPVNKDESLSEFERVVSDYPVFRIKIGR